MYSKKVMDHFRNPRNYGKIEDADASARVGNPTCGDVLEIFIKIGKRGGREYIKDIKFQTFGCAAALACSSVLTVMAKGKTLDEAMKITNKEVAKALGYLPPIKTHCSNLAADALHKAIEKYRKK